MQNKIISNLDSLIENEKPHFLLAVSGGIDSMVLLKFFQKNHESYKFSVCLLYTSPSPRDQRGSRMPSSA